MNESTLHLKRMVWMQRRLSPWIREESEGILSLSVTIKKYGRYTLHTMVLHEGLSDVNWTDADVPHFDPEDMKRLYKKYSSIIRRTNWKERKDIYERYHNMVQHQRNALDTKAAASN